MFFFNFNISCTSIHLAYYQTMYSQQMLGCNPIPVRSSSFSTSIHILFLVDNGHLCFDYICLSCMTVTYTGAINCLISFVNGYNKIEKLNDNIHNTM